jgi:glutaredoxin
MTKVTTMASRFLFSLSGFLFAVTFSFSAHAQMYKWVDADGKVTYSDVPPPKTAVKVETKSFSSSDDGATTGLPYELTRIAKNMPVTLYTSAKCPGCDEGRNFLKQNGIPFSEKTVSTNADIEKLTKVSGGPQLPFVQVGRTKLVGYSPTDWRSALSAAGYPESSQLPGDYQYPAPQPAAPVVVQQKNDGTTPTQGQPDQPARDPNAFQF